MMKNFFLLALLCCALVGYSQPKLTLGQPYEVIDAPGKFYLSKGNYLVTVKVMKKGIYLQKLNTDKLSLEKVRFYDDLPKGFTLELVTEFDNKYYVFYSAWDGDNEMLFAREIDFDEGTFKSTGKKIVSVGEKITGTMSNGGFFSAGVSDKYDFYFAANGSTMAIQYRLKPEVRNDSKSHDNIGLHILDSDLNEIWGNRVRMPYTEKKMNNLDYSVDSKGNAYIVTTVYDDDTTDEKKRGSKEPNYHIEILKIEAKTAVITPIKVDLAGNFVKTLLLIENPQGYITCAGFYNIGKRAANADGIIMFKLGQDNQTYDFKTYEIPVEVLNQFASNRTKRKNNSNDGADRAEFENLVLKNLVIQKDGSIILLGEQAYSVTRSYYNAITHTSQTYTIYYYNDMLATKIDSEGKLAWMKKLPKRQQSQSGGGSMMMGFNFGSRNRLGGMSFYYFPMEGKHYLLYLDNEKNINLPINSVPAFHTDGQGGFLTSYAIDDQTGNVQKVSILDTRDVQGTQLFQFTPRRIKEISNTAFVFEAYIKKKEDILIKVELPK
jgi:hypothetical protein